MRFRQQKSRIDTAPLVGVSAGLLMAAVPLIEHVEAWSIAMFAGALFMRIMVNRWHLNLPSLPLKILVLAVGLGGIAISYGSMLGIEPGLGILLILVSLKLLETNTVRDFQVLTLLGWFLSLCGLFFAQDLGTWLYIGMTCLVLTASLIRFHRGAAPGSFPRSIRLAFTILVQAAPLILLLFFFFPRTYGGLRFTFSRALTNPTGISDRIEPGSVSSLALSDEIAFRVEFPDGKVPQISDMYWRGGVLWRGDGLTWVRGNLPRTEPFLGRLGGEPIRQRIVLEPHGARWIFALDRPASGETKMRFEPGGYLQSVNPVVTPLRYEITSRPENRETALLPEQRSAALYTPTRPSPQLEALVKSWVAGAEDDRAVVEAALQFFEKGNFSYTLAPGAYGRDALDEFLFRRKSGFCEHYAAAFATLMRLAGVPSRIVIGYHGGEFNNLGSYLRVRQSDAHAWCEVWLKGIGWVRKDPVNSIAPARIQGGLESFLQSASAGGGPTGIGPARANATLRELWNQARLAWDSLNYQWDLRVLNFDEDSQRTFLMFIGLGRSMVSGTWEFSALITWLVLVSVALLCVVALWVTRAETPHRDPAAREYARFCRALARAGVARAESEGPLHFSERAAAEFPTHADSIRRICDLFIRLRYAKSPPSTRELSREIAAFHKRPPRREKDGGLHVRSER